MACLSKFTGIVTLLASIPVQANCLFEDAIELFNAGNEKQSAIGFEQCIEAGEQLPESNFYRGILARNAGNLDMAMQMLSEAVRLNPETLSYRLERAVTAEWLGRLDEASKIYETALAIDPESLPARLGSARMNHWQGRLAQSLRQYHQLAREYPADAAVTSGYAFALMADRKLAKAQALFEKILAGNPADTSAKQGIQMLGEMSNHRFEVDGGEVRDAAGNETTQTRVVYTNTPAYAFKWGVELIERDGFIAPPTNSGTPSNRAVKSSLAAFSDYRFNGETSAFFSLRHEQLVDRDRQYKAHLELMHKLAENHRVFAGVIPAYLNGSRVNTLSYAGYVYQSPNKWNAMAQYYYGQDRDFDSSQSLSLAWTTNYGKKNYLRLGVSFGRSTTSDTETLYASGVHYMRQNIAMKASLLNNLNTDESELTLGVIYEF